MEDPIKAVGGPANPAGTVPEKEVRVEDLTDIEAISQMLRQLGEKQQRVDEDLEHYLATHTEIRKHVSSLQELGPRLKFISQDSIELAKKIASSAELAEGVCGKVRELDVAQSRAKEALERVGDIVDLKHCIDGVKMAMQDEEYETAASHIERFLGFEEDVLEEVSVEVLRAAHQKLTQVVRQRVKEAAERGDLETVLRFTTLFSKVGLGYQGLQTFGEYLGSRITQQAEHDYQESLANPDLDDDNAFVDPLSRLFEFVAVCVLDHKDVVDERFGTGSMVAVITQLQKKCDQHGSTITSQFVRQRRLLDEARHCEKLSKRRRQRSSTTTADRQDGQAQVVDVLHLDPLLNECALLCQRSDTYDHFMRGEAKKANELLTSAGKNAHEVCGLAPDVVLIDGLIQTNKMNEEIQKIMGHYITIEETFVYECVRKAMRMADTTEDEEVSTVVDDVFYILQKCCRRAIETHSGISVCAVLNNVNTVLNTIYKDMLSTQVDEYAKDTPNTGTRRVEIKLPFGSDNVRSPSARFLTALNNIEVSTKYLNKLKAELTTQIQVVFKDRESELSLINPSLGELGESAVVFKKEINRAFTKLVNMLLPAINKLTESMSNVNYQLNDTEYAEADVNEPFVKPVLEGLRGILKPCEAAMTKANYEQLVHLVIQLVAKGLEKAVTRRKFTQLGGLRFDKDVRVLVQFFSDETSRTVRDKFARVTQIASILNLDKAAEILEYWGQNSGAVLWRLSAAEVRKILGLRVDFSPEQIARLKL